VDRRRNRGGDRRCAGSSGGPVDGQAEALDDERVLCARRRWLDRVGRKRMFILKHAGALGAGHAVVDSFVW